MGDGGGGGDCGGGFGGGGGDGGGGFSSCGGGFGGGGGGFSGCGDGGGFSSAGGGYGYGGDGSSYGPGGHTTHPQGGAFIHGLHGGGAGGGRNRRIHHSSPGFKYVGYRANNCNNPAAMAVGPMIAGTVFLIQGCVFTSIGFSTGHVLTAFKVIGPTFLCLGLLLLLAACFCCKKARDNFNRQGGQHTIQVVTSTAPRAPGQTVVAGAPVDHTAPTVTAGASPGQYPPYPASDGHTTTPSGSHAYQQPWDHAYQPSNIGLSLPPSYYEATGADVSARP